MNKTQMNEQTIGVEIEMNNIRREKAAKIAADFFGTGRYEYTDEGYKTWTAYDQQGNPWKFQRDSSIAGPDAERCELTTPILKVEDIPTLQELCRQLRHAGAKSDATRGCGVHIHIGAKGHTPQSLRNLANIMASHEELIANSLKISDRRTNSYCRVSNPEFIRRLNKEKPQTMSQLADIWYESHGASWGRTHHYNDSRYHMLNLHATFTKGTVEFRLFQFDAPSGGKQNGLHAGQLKSYIQLCLALSEMAKMGFTVVPFGQGFKDMSPPTKELMKLTLEQRIAHGGHPVLRWMMDNIFIRTDPAGNIKADKEKSTEKIDGAIATIMALDRAVRCGNVNTESVYDQRGILFI